MLHLLYIFLIKNKYKYIRLQIICAFIFSILYFIQDFLMIKYNDIMVKLKLGKRIENGKLNSYMYYIWFSLITQSTVGYQKITNNISPVDQCS